MSFDSEDLEKSGAMGAYPVAPSGSPDQPRKGTRRRKGPHWRPNTAAIRLRTFMYPIILDALCIAIGFALLALALVIHVVRIRSGRGRPAPTGDRADEPAPAT